MKRLLRTSILLIVGTALSFSALRAAGTARENERLQHGKITKTEAQHLVLQKFPAAKIRKCELKSGQGHSYFVVELLERGATKMKTVRVDGRTGQITP